MSGFRFTTMGALIAVLAIAAALGALRANSETVAGLAAALFGGLLCLSIVGSVVCRGDRRVVWLGFAVFGWAYAATVWFTEPAMAYTPSRAPARHVLPTSRLLEWFARMQSSYAVGSRVMAQWRGGGWYSATIDSYDPDGNLYSVRWDDGSPPEWVSTQQMQIGNGAGVRGGHAILGPLVAALGALVSRWCFGGKEEGGRMKDEG